MKRRQVVGSPRQNVTVLGLWNSYEARSFSSRWLLLPRNFVHIGQGDPDYHNNRKWLLFARRRAAAADRPEKRALFPALVNFERTLQLELTWRIFTNKVSPFSLGKDLSIGAFRFKIRAKMIPQRRSKSIDDYPSKFDWPGIKGLKVNFFFFFFEERA